MNILFLTILRINDISDRGIYPDLMRKFNNEGHDVYIVTPLERRYKQRTTIFQKNKSTILKIRTLNIQKTTTLEKWVETLLINKQFLRGIRMHFSEIRFDMVIYSTPPITFTKLIHYIKQKDGAVSYLLLKDIFPQNAVDLGLIKKRGLLHRYFRKKEKQLYKISDYIGCMSQANVDYLVKNNPEINIDKIEINPNSHEFFEESITQEQKQILRNNYNIPANATVFIYGGNLGLPQGIEFIIDFLNSQLNKKGVFFIIVGSGTKFNKLKAWFDKKRPGNAMLLSELPKNEYNLLLKSCDVGMVFLDRRFTIPNFPSRLLSFLEFKMPIIAATDKVSDVGKIMEENRFGLWSESGDIQTIDQNVTRLTQDARLLATLGLNGFNYFIKNFTVSTSYNTIIKHFNNS